MLGFFSSYMMFVATSIGLSASIISSALKMSSSVNAQSLAFFLTLRKEEEIQILVLSFNSYFIVYFLIHYELEL